MIGDPDPRLHDLLERSLTDHPIDVEAHLHEVHLAADRPSRRPGRLIAGLVAAVVLLVGLQIGITQGAPPGVLAFVDRGNVVVAEGSSRTTVTNTAGFGSLSLTSDGRRIAATRSVPGSNFTHIYSMDADGSGLLPLTDGHFNDIEPAWSPDGSRLLFASDRQGSFDLFVIDAQQSSALPLTRGLEDDTYPSWSPLGGQIAFVRTTVDGSNAIMAADASGGYLHVVAQLPVGASPDQLAWSPDARQIAYSDGTDIRILDVVTGSTRAVTSDEATDRFPTWSPDGRLIAFKSFRKDHWGIYMVHPDGSDLDRRFSITPAADDGTSWQAGPTS